MTREETITVAGLIESLKTQPPDMKVFQSWPESLVAIWPQDNPFTIIDNCLYIDTGSPLEFDDGEQLPLVMAPSDT